MTRKRQRPNNQSSNKRSKRNEDPTPITLEEFESLQIVIQDTFSIEQKRCLREGSENEIRDVFKRGETPKMKEVMKASKVLLEPLGVTTVTNLSTQKMAHLFVQHRPYLVHLFDSLTEQSIVPPSNIPDPDDLSHIDFGSFQIKPGDRVVLTKKLDERIVRVGEMHVKIVRSDTVSGEVIGTETDQLELDAFIDWNIENAIPLNIFTQRTEEEKEYNDANEFLVVNKTPSKKQRARTEVQPIESDPVQIEPASEAQADSSPSKENVEIKKLQLELQQSNAEKLKLKETLDFLKNENAALHRLLLSVKTDNLNAAQKIVDGLKLEPKGDGIREIAVRDQKVTLTASVAREICKNQRQTAMTALLRSAESALELDFANVKYSFGKSIVPDTVKLEEDQVEEILNLCSIYCPAVSKATPSVVRSDLHEVLVTLRTGKTKTQRRKIKKDSGEQDGINE